MPFPYLPLLCKPTKRLLLFFFSFQPAHKMATFLRPTCRKSNIGGFCTYVHSALSTKRSPLLAAESGLVLSRPAFLKSILWHCTVACWKSQVLANVTETFVATEFIPRVKKSELAEPGLEHLSKRQQTKLLRLIACFASFIIPGFHFLFPSLCFLLPTAPQENQLAPEEHMLR